VGDYRKKASIDDMTGEEILHAVHDALLEARRNVSAKKRKQDAKAAARSLSARRASKRSSTRKAKKK
jgi:hypothetical protein